MKRNWRHNADGLEDEKQREPHRDLLLADIVEIGSYGVVVQQAVSLINYILRLTQPAGTPGVRQLALYRSLPPIGPEFDPQQAIPDPDYFISRLMHTAKASLEKRRWLRESAIGRDCPT